MVTSSATRAMVPSRSRSDTSLDVEFRRSHVKAALLRPPATEPTIRARTKVTTAEVPSQPPITPVPPKKVKTNAMVESGMTESTPSLSASRSSPSASAPLKANHSSRGNPAANMKTYSPVIDTSLSTAIVVDRQRPTAAVIGPPAPLSSPT